MLIVVIAWLYVVVLMALTQTSVLAGIGTFVFYGALPIGILLWLSGSGRRRQRRREAEAEVEMEAVEVAEPDDGLRAEKPAASKDDRSGAGPDHARSVPPSDRTGPRADSSRSGPPD